MMFLVTIFYRKYKIYMKRQIKATRRKKRDIRINVTWLKRDNRGFQVKPEQAPLSFFGPATCKQGNSGLIYLHLANFRASESCVLAKFLGRRKIKKRENTVHSMLG